MKLREGPEHALGVILIQRLIVVVKIHPASLAGDVAPPVFGVFQNRGPAEVVELTHAKLFDLRAPRDS